MRSGSAPKADPWRRTYSDADGGAPLGPQAELLDQGHHDLRSVVLDEMPSVGGANGKLQSNVSPSGMPPMRARGWTIRSSGPVRTNHDRAETRRQLRQVGVRPHQLPAQDVRGQPRLERMTSSKVP